MIMGSSILRFWKRGQEGSLRPASLDSLLPDACVRLRFLCDLLRRYWRLLGFVSLDASTLIH